MDRSPGAMTQQLEQRNWFRASELVVRNLPAFEIVVDVDIEVKLSFLHEVHNAHRGDGFRDRCSLKQRLCVRPFLSLCLSETPGFCPVDLVVVDHRDADRRNLVPLQLLLDAPFLYRLSRNDNRRRNVVLDRREPVGGLLFASLSSR
jgi:hypothetical protein